MTSWSSVGATAGTAAMGVIAAGEQAAATGGAEANQGLAMGQMAAMANRAMEMELFKDRLEEMKGLTKGVGKQIEDAGKAATQG